MSQPFAEERFNAVRHPGIHQLLTLNDFEKLFFVFKWEWVTLRGWKGPTVKALPSVKFEAPKKYACPLRAGDRAGATGTCGKTRYEGDEERKETHAKESKAFPFTFCGPTFFDLKVLLYWLHAFPLACLMFSDTCAY
jgi:hypothetical protein